MEIQTGCPSKFQILCNIFNPNIPDLAALYSFSLTKKQGQQRTFHTLNHRMVHIFFQYQLLLRLVLVDKMSFFYNHSYWLVDCMPFPGAAFIRK